MLAPSPPSPPSGPPRGTYFSRRRLAQPSPPLPAQLNQDAINKHTSHSSLRMEAEDSQPLNHVRKHSTTRSGAAKPGNGSRRNRRRFAAVPLRVAYPGLTFKGCLPCDALILPDPCHADPCHADPCHADPCLNFQSGGIRSSEFSRNRLGILARGSRSNSSQRHVTSTRRQRRPRAGDGPKQVGPSMTMKAPGLQVPPCRTIIIGTAKDNQAAGPARTAGECSPVPFRFQTPESRNEFRHPSG